jgi:hypothetical protein
MLYAQFQVRGSQVKEVMKTLSEGPEGFYKAH